MKDVVAPFRKRLSPGAGWWAAACRAVRPAQCPSGRWRPKTLRKPWPPASGAS